MARKRQSGKESNEKLVAIMKEWQKVEEKSIKSIGEISRKIKNPLVKQVLSIIKKDSAQHAKVQQFVIDSLTKKPVTLTPEELGAVWSAIDSHIKMERATIELGQRAKDASRDFVHKYLINYLMTDERKHEELLEQLENIKSKIYPYA